MSNTSIESVFIVGAAGQLGQEIREVFQEARVIAPSHAEAPLEDSAILSRLLEQHQPDVVVNCSAFHQVDQCESQPERAFEINAVAVGNAALACKKHGIRFVTMSTDYVFSGDKGSAYDESDAARPQNVYGISKLAGEHFAMEANPRTFVFRLSGVFGRTGYSNKGPTFVERMISMAERHEPISVVDNIVFSPTYTVDAAQKIREIVERDEPGLYHLTNSGECSWYDLAVEAIQAAGLSAEVSRTKYQEQAGSIKRPIYSALAHQELNRRGFTDLPSWREAVASYAAERHARVSSAV